MTGSPQLSQPPHTSDRSEADALRERIEAALTVAKNAVGHAREQASLPSVALLTLGMALDYIINILSGGHAPEKPQKETM